MNEFWENLSASERRTVVIGAVALALILIYMVVWKPLDSRVSQLDRTIDSQEQLLAWMQAAAVEAKKLQGSQSADARSTGGQSLLALVDQTARQSKLGDALKRVEPRGQDSVRVRLEQASFDHMVTWLGELQSKYGIAVDSISVDRHQLAGRIDASVLLQGGGQ